MPRSFWTGYLKLSLVTCPVTMAPAVSAAEKVRFHTLNRRTGHRVLSQFVDAVTGAPVGAADEARGYPSGEDSFVLLEDEELDAVALDSTRTIDVTSFVPAGEVGWPWYDKPHYLTPADKVGEEAFCVIREAMAATDRVGLSRLVLYRRERAVMLVPRGKGIVLWTLRFADEVRDAAEYFADIPDIRPDREALALAGDLIAARRRPWAPALVNDPVQESLLALIARRRKGRKPPPRKDDKAESPGETGNVINIMDALRRSLAKAGGKPGASGASGAEGGRGSPRK